MCGILHIVSTYIDAKEHKMALKTALQNLGTSLSEILVNQAESGVVLKVSSLFVSNYLASGDAFVDIEIGRGGSSFSILRGGLIPAGRTLSVFISKDIGVYLEEGDSLKLKASAPSSLDAVCSYSEIDPTATCEPLCLE
jgi:hypothetical protein